MTKKYRLRPGVVPVTVCGETMLVTGREARGKCPYTVHFNPISTYYFSLLQRGLDLDEMVLEAASFCKVEDDFIRPKIESFISQLLEYGYILAEDDQ